MWRSRRSFDPSDGVLGLGVEHHGVKYAGVGVSDTTVASYQEPEEDYWPLGPGKDALYFGPAPNHAGTATRGPPVVGDEWIVVEHELDLRRDRDNPNGLNRLWVWTRDNRLRVWTSDGVLAGPILDIPLTWNEHHNFAGDRFFALDGLGYDWNPSRGVGLDTALAVVGEPASFTALVTRQLSETTLEETGETVSR